MREIVQSFKYKTKWQALCDSAYKAPQEQLIPPCFTKKKVSLIRGVYKKFGKALKELMDMD